MKKRFLALLLVLTLLVGLMPAALAADTVDVSALPEYTAGADTSAGAAYKISTEESLRAFAAAVKADGGNGTYNLSGVSFYLAILPMTLPSPARGSRSATAYRRLRISFPVRSMAAAIRSAA